MTVSKSRSPALASGVVGGYAPLSSGLLVPAAYLPVGTGAAQLAAGNHTHGSLLGIQSYTPGSDSDIKSSTSTTLEDVDTTNAIVTFTAPASGSVIVEITANAQVTGAQSQLYWGVREGSTIVGAKSFILGVYPQGIRTTARWYITGISAGAHTYKAAICVDAQTGHMSGGPTLGPLVMEVWAAGDIPPTPVAATPDPIYETFGVPTTAFEFGASDFTGLTAMGSPDEEVMHTQIPNHLWLKDNDATVVGRYAAQSPPFTAITAISDALLYADYMYAGIFCGIATPGKMVFSTIRYSGGTALAILTLTGPGDGSAGQPGLLLGASNPYAKFPIWLAIRAASSTDVSYYFSRDGYRWYPMLIANDNSMTVGSVGLGVAGYGGATSRAAFDYLRIWNTAKTFPVYS